MAPHRVQNFEREDSADYADGADQFCKRCTAHIAELRFLIRDDGPADRANRQPLRCYRLFDKRRPAQVAEPRVGIGSWSTTVSTFSGHILISKFISSAA